MMQYFLTLFVPKTNFNLETKCLFNIASLKIMTIGNDHGGGSFKLSYRIANVSHPKIIDSTVVFNIFEAEDYRSNVKIGLTRFQEQINTLQTWR